MTQDQCLSLPSHFTHLGVCYPGNNASLQLSDPNHPQAVKFQTTSVPEPATGTLLALALILGALSARPRRGTKLG